MASNTHFAPTPVWRQEAPNRMITGVLTQKRTVILIELPFFSFRDKMTQTNKAEGLPALLADDW